MSEVTTEPKRRGRPPTKHLDVATVELEPRQERSPLDTRPETLYTFEAKVSSAKLNGEEFVETTEDVFKYITKNHPTQYLTYHGIRVYLKGTREEIEREERMSIDEREVYRAEKRKRQ